MQRSAVHNNGHIICAVDVETTGLVPGYHEVWQFAAVPLDSHLRPMDDITPFDMKMAPQYIDRVETLSREDLCELLERSLAPDRVADLFDGWFKGLPLPRNKKLIPLAHNWVFDQAHLGHWLGWEHLQSYFFGHYRDTMTAALYLSDYADLHALKFAFNAYSLSGLCKALGVKNERPHDALHDCLATAECYRRLANRGLR